MFKKISKNDIQIIIFSSLIFLGSFAILYFDLFNLQSIASDQPVVATAVQISNDVRLKAKEQFAWSKTLNKASIRNGDQIFTGEKSKAIVQLIDGQRLNITENSLVKFDQNKNIKNFKIVFGSVKTQLKKNEIIEVVICGEKHRIKSETDDELTISNNENCAKPEIKFNKSKNSVQLKKKKNELSNLVTALVEKRKPAPLPPPPPPPLVLSTPEIKQSILKFPAALKKKKILWSAVPQAHHYIVQLYDRENPTVVLKKYETMESFFEFTPDPDIIDYIYSVQAVNVAKEFLPSEVVKGQIGVQHSPIRINQTAKSFTMNARTSDQAAKPIIHLIEWSKVPRASYYKVEFSEDVTFQNLSKTYKSPVNSLKTEVTDFGRKYYKIKAYNSKGRETTKSTEPAVLEYTKKFDLLSPEIPLNSKDTSLFFQNTGGQFIRLSWKNDQAAIASKYYIEISKTEDFSQIFKKISSNQTNLVLNELIPQGQYYWRVKSYGQDIVSDWSQTARLNIKSKREIAVEDSNSEANSKTNNKNQKRK